MLRYSCFESRQSVDLVTEGDVIDVISSSDSHSEFLQEIVFLESIQQGQQTEIVQDTQELVVSDMTIADTIEIFEQWKDL